MEIKRLSDQMISESFAKHAQDVYVLPASEVFYIYFRYGKKRTFWKEVSSADGQQLISRFKYLGQMDIGEKRKAQLGALTYYLFFRKTEGSVTTVFCRRLPSTRKLSDSAIIRYF